MPDYDVILRVENVLIEPRELKVVLDNLAKAFSNQSPWPTKVVEIKELA